MLHASMAALRTCTPIEAERNPRRRCSRSNEVAERAWLAFFRGSNVIRAFVGSELFLAWVSQHIKEPRSSRWVCARVQLV